MYRAPLASLSAAFGLVAVSSFGVCVAAAEPIPLDATVRSKIDTDVRALLSATHTQGATIAIVHALPKAQFLRFGYRFEQVATNLNRTEDERAVERTEDGQVRYQDGNGVEDHPEHRFPYIFIRPDLLNKPAAATAAQFGMVTDGPYQVIGSTGTRTTHYTITDASTEVTADCPGATHLRLRPKAGADPFYYNLRELWIAPTGRACKAIAVWNYGYFINRRFVMAFTLDFAAETGLITRWTSIGVARAGPFRSSYHIEGRFTNVTAESGAPAGFFDR